MLTHIWTIRPPSILNMIQVYGPRWSGNQGNLWVLSKRGRYDSVRMHTIVTVNIKTLGTSSRGETVRTDGGVNSSNKSTYRTAVALERERVRDSGSHPAPHVS